MVEQANTFGIPLLSLKYGTAFSDITDPILQQVIGAQTALLRRNAEINRRMINLLIHGGGFDKIAAMIHQENNLPVVICSTAGAVLADVGEFDHSAVNVYELSNIQAPENWQPIFRTAVEYKVWVCPVTYANEHYATILIIIPPTNRCDGLAERQIVEQASHIIVLEVTRSQKKKTVEHRFRAEFIENIIHGRIDGLDRAIAVGREYGWDLSGSFIPAILKTDTHSFSGKAGIAMSDVYVSPRGSFNGFMSQYPDVVYISVDMRYETLLLFPLQMDDADGYARRMEAPRCRPTCSRC
jgi:purine catabolism regulator